MKILLIDDQEVVREGIRRIFERADQSYTFGDASKPQEAVQKLQSESWDGAILDISLREFDGLEVLKDLKRLRPELPVLVFSAFPEQQYAVRAFRAGAAGYLAKTCGAAELIAALTRTASGGRYVSTSLAERLVTHLERGTTGAPHEILSDREFEVFRWIASGKTVGEIAGLLGLSDKTISTYRARILRKMSMHSNAELTHYAAQNRIT